MIVVLFMIKKKVMMFELILFWFISWKIEKKNLLVYFYNVFEENYILIIY